MLRIIKIILLGIIAIALIMIAVANRQWVQLELLPAVIGDFIGFNTGLRLPLFVVVFGGVGIGLLIGYILEYLREHKLRSAARQEHKQVVKLEREVGRLKAEKHSGHDDVLALLDD